MDKSNLSFSELGSTLIGILRNTHYIPHSEIIERLNLRKDEFYEILLDLSGNGFEFDAHPDAGVRLLDIPELLTPELVTNSLNTEKIGRNIHHSTSIESTNSKAIELASQDAPEGTLVVTEYQSRGRGRLKRKWEAPPFSSILATLLLKPISPSLGPVVVLVTALTVVESLRKLGMDACIRWPNDVVVDGRKICGILAETGMSYMVCGFGLNVNQNSFHSELAASATSMRAQLHRSHSRAALLKSILQGFEQNYDKLLSGNTQEILERIREVSWSVGKRVNLFTGNSTVTGCILGIDDSGSLVLKQDYGRILRISPQGASLLNG